MSDREQSRAIKQSRATERLPSNREQSRAIESNREQPRAIESNREQSRAIERPPSRKRGGSSRRHTHLKREQEPQALQTIALAVRAVGAVPVATAVISDAAVQQRHLDLIGEREGRAKAVVEKQPAAGRASAREAVADDGFVARLEVRRAHLMAMANPTVLRSVLTGCSEGPHSAVSGERSRIGSHARRGPPSA